MAFCIHDKNFFATTAPLRLSLWRWVQICLRKGRSSPLTRTLRSESGSKPRPKDISLWRCFPPSRTVSAVSFYRRITFTSDVTRNSYGLNILALSLAPPTPLPGTSA